MQLGRCARFEHVHEAAKWRVLLTELHERTHVLM